MIERYTRPEMGAVWEPENRFQKMLEVEKAVAVVQADMKMIPKIAAQQILKNSKFSLKRIADIEQVTKHDVMAFVKNVAENVGPHGKYLHFGLTSSDVLDTAFSLQVREASLILQVSMNAFEKSLETIIKKNTKTLCAGRTHGMWAEPVTFAFKMASFLSEHQRNQKRLKNAIEQFCVVKLSGAVGTYSTLPPQLESKVGQKLKLKIEDVATQVVPRDRHAELIFAISMIGSNLERLAVELRHLQRSEVAEVTEGFSQGQTGSSVMPHKKNPISSENITGLNRLLKSYLQASLDNIVLWHERDISHSSVERVIFPDAFILCDYMLARMTSVLDKLVVNKKRMLENIEQSKGVLFTSHLLLALVEQGLSRDEAYKHIQRLSHSLRDGEHLSTQIQSDPFLKDYLKPKDLKKLFSGDKYIQSTMPVIQRVLKKKRLK